MDLDTAIELFEVGAVKFGSFRLKSGVDSPVYLDLRVMVAYPGLMKRISEMMWEKAKALEFDQVCGVPYTALPLATCISVAHEIPMIIRRKEVKEYGTKKQIEGVFEKGETCLILEDVMTSGSSILETTDSLRNEGLKVSDAIVIVDRGQGGKKRLEEKGIKVHALTTLSELATLLYEASKIDKPLLTNILALCSPF
jgi:uridine monophosphate synthetase